MKNTNTVASSVKAPKTLSTSILKAKQSLEAKAKKHGLYENFGQAEVSFIQEKFIELGDFSDAMLRKRSEIKRFSEWCENFEVTA